MKKDSIGYKPEYLTEPDLPGTWKAMEALYDSGKARAIGVSNFSTKKLGDLLEVARVSPAVNQVECHPKWQQPKLHAFCKSKGVHLTVSMIILSKATDHIIKFSIKAECSHQFIMSFSYRPSTDYSLKC